MPPPTLVLGDGDWSAVNTYIAGLGQFGTGHYEDYQPIAHWRAVYGGLRVAPYIMVTGDLYLGITPFHGCATGPNSGITRVRFSLEGGAFTDVAEWSPNPETGEWAWWVKVDGASLADAVDYEVVAIAEPEQGFARIFQGAIDEAHAQQQDHSFWFAANPTNTLTTREVFISGTGDDSTGTGTSGSPWRNLRKAIEILNDDGDIDGGIVTCKAGTYTWPPFAGNPFIYNGLYIEVRRFGAAAAFSAQVTFAETEHFQGLGAARVRLTLMDVTAVNELGQAGDTPTAPHVPAPFAWADRCRFGSNGSFSPGFRQDKYPSGVWYTGCRSTNLDTGPDGVGHMEGHEADTVTEDALRHILCLMDSYIHDVVQDNPLAHPDTLQYQAPLVGTAFKNVLLMNVKTDRIGNVDNAVQGLPFIRHLNAVPKWVGLAMVNCESHCAGLAQILHSIDHFIRWNCSALKYDGIGGNFFIDDNDSEGLTTTLNGQSMKGCVDTQYAFAASGGGDNMGNANVWADNNTYFAGSGNTPGTNAVTGVTDTDLFVNPSAGNFLPLLSGPLASRMTAVVPFDIDNNARDETTASGARASSAETGATMPDIDTQNIRFRFDTPISVTAVNDGSPVVSVEITDPTHAPPGIDVEVVGDTFRTFGTPTRM